MEKIKGPFLRNKDNTSKIMARLMVALIPIILFAIYKNGYLPYKEGYVNIFGLFYPLVFIITGCITSFLTELIYYLIRGLKDEELTKKILKSYSLFPGLFLSLVLPINTPIVILILGTIFGVVIGKLLYGGFGNNVFNPALIGYLFITVCYGSVISTGYSELLKGMNSITSATPLTNIAIINGVGTYDLLVKPYGSLLSFLFGMIPGSIGETCKILIILSFIYLSVRGVVKFRITLFYVLTVFGITSIIAGINNVGLWYPLFQILSGGLIFGAVFMSTDPVTSPVTRNGQILYGICLGILTVVFRYLTAAPEGVMMAILTMNMLVFIIDKIGNLSNFKARYLTISISVLIIIVMLLSYNISLSYKNIDTTKDENYNIISKKKDNNKFIYVVTEKGNGGNIKASITFEKNKIASIEILENSETSAYYKKITDSKYIDKLINEQANIDNVDTVTGATISSTALKKMVINTINDYKINGNEEIENNDTSVIINSKVENNDNSITYNVDTETFGGTMNIDIIVINKKVVNIKINKFNDSCYTKTHTTEYYKCPTYIEDTNYIDELIVNQADIDRVDSITGATVTSNGIKKAIKKVIGES